MKTIHKASWLISLNNYGEFMYALSTQGLKTIHCELIKIIFWEIKTTIYVRTCYMFWARGEMQTNTSMILDTTNIWANGRVWKLDRPTEGSCSKRTWRLSDNRWTEWGAIFCFKTKLFIYPDIELSKNRSWHPHCSTIIGNLWTP